MTSSDGARPVPVRAALLAVALPLVLLGAAVVLLLAWAPRLPDPVASHWGSGGVNGTASLTGLVLGVAGIGVLLTVLLAPVALAPSTTAPTRRLVVGLASGTAAFLAGVLVLTTVIQLDVPTAAQVPDLPVGSVLAVALGGVVVGAAAAALVPADPDPGPVGPVPADAARAALGPGRPDTWSATVVTPHLGIVTTGSALVVLAVVVLTREPVLLLLLLVPVLVHVLGSWRVSVDGTGAWAHPTALACARTGVPIDRVVRADVVRVSPLREFGGWGIRASRDGRQGLVLRAGETLAVQRAGGGTFVATVDDAGTAAALLNALADRDRP